MPSNEAAHAAGFQTRTIHAGHEADAFGAVSPPIYLTSTYAFESVSYTHLTLPTKA